MNSILENVNWITPDRYITYHYIREYDISKANISMLYAYDVISTDLYNELYHMDKRSREIYIGLMIRREKAENDGVSVSENYIKLGIKFYKDEFVKLNGINEKDIVRIANDALTIKSGKDFTNTQFMACPNFYVEFRLAGEYTSMVKLAKVIVFINTENGVVDIKGINDEKVPLHREFLTRIARVLIYHEAGDDKMKFMEYNQLYSDYINHHLPVECYREFNAESAYRIKSSHKSFVALNYGLSILPNTTKDIIDKLDISYNLHVLRELYSIIIS